MSSKRKFNRKSKYTLSQKIISAVTAAGFIMQPFTAFAGEIVKPGGQNLINNNVANIWADRVVDKTAVNVFDKFNLSANEIANMYFGTSQASHGADNLVNFVNSRIDINGTVNAVQNNKIGGNLFFLSADGMAVGKSGVINTGSLYVMTPTQSYMENAMDVVGNPTDTGAKAALDNVVDTAKWQAIPVNASGTITVLGQVNATNEVKMRAAKIGVGKNVSGTDLNDGENGAVGTKVNEVVKTAAIKTGITNFANVVKLTDEQQKAAGITNLKATVAENSGDIILEAYVDNKSNPNAVADVPVVGETLDGIVNWGENNFKAQNFDASVDIYGTVDAAGKADISATAVNSNVDVNKIGNYVDSNNTDVAQLANVKANVNIGNDGKVIADGDVTVKAEAINRYVDNTGAVAEGVKLMVSSGSPLTVDAAYSVLDTEANVNIEKGATVTSGGNVDIDAKAETLAASAASTMGLKFKTVGGFEGANVPAAAVVYTEAHNDAKVTVNGDVTAAENVSIDADADLTIDAENKMTVTGEKANQFVVGVTIANASNNADVTIGVEENKDNSGNVTTATTGKSVTATGDLTVNAKADSDFTSKTSISAGESSAVGVAVNVTNFNSGANVNVNTKLKAGKDLTVNAADTIAADNVIAESKVGSGKYMSSAMQVMGQNGTIDSIKGFASNLAEKMLLPKLGEDLKTNLSMGDVIKAGATVTYSGQNHNSGVTIGNDASLTAGGKLDIDAQTLIEDAHFTATGATNSYNDATSAPVTINAAVLVTDMNNSSSVVVKDAVTDKDGTEHKAELKGTGGVEINASTRFEYNRVQKMKDAVTDAAAQIKNAFDQMDEAFKKEFAGDIPEWFENLKTKYKSAYEAFNGKMKDVDANGQQLASGDGNFIDAIVAGYQVLTALDELNAMLDENKGNAVVQQFGEAFKGASDLFSGALAFVDPNSYGTFAAASTSKGSSGDVGGSAPGGGSVTGAVGGQNAAAINGAGAVMVNTVNSVSKVEIGSDAEITSERKVNIGAENYMKDVSLGGLNLGLFNNAGGGTTASIGATVNYADFDTDTIVAVNDGASLTGGNIGINAQNTIDHVSVAASAGKGPSSQTGSNGAVINGMFSFVNGSSDILTVVDDGASLKANQNGYTETVKDEETGEETEVTGTTEGNISINGHNNTNITNVAAGASWGHGSATVGAGLAYTDFEVKNITGVADVAEQIKGLYTYKERSTDDDGEEVVEYVVDEDKVKEFTEKLTNDYEKGAGKGSITAYGFSVDAATDGSIQSVSAAGTLSNDDASGQIGFFDKIGSGLNSLDQKLVGQGGLVDKASSSFLNTGENGKKMNGFFSMGQNTHGAGNANSNGINIVSTGTGAGNANINTFMPSFSLAGSGSVSINMLDNATEAIVDNAKIIMKETGGKKGDITVRARDTLYAGAYSGAAAVQWNAGGQSSDKAVAISGAAGVNDIANAVKATIKNSTIDNAGALNTMALSGGEQLALGLGMTVVKADGTSGYSGNAAVSVNLIDHDVEALLENNTVTNTDDVNVAAYARDIENTGGGALSLGQQKVGVGASVGVAMLHNNISAGIKGGSYTNVENVNVEAKNALQNVTVGIAAGLTIPSSGDSASANVEGAGVYNEVHNTTNAFIEGSDNEDVVISTFDGGKVNVTAQDVKVDNNSFYEKALGELADGREVIAQRMNEDGKDGEDGKKFDITGKTELEGLDMSSANDELGNGETVNLTKNTGSSIITVAGGLAATTGKGSGGAAIAITDIENNYTANIDYADITTENLKADAGSDSNIVTVAGGIGAANKASGVGSVSWNDVDNTAKVNIKNSVVKAQETEATAENNAQIVSVTGQISGGKDAAVGAALGYVGLDNSTEANISNTTFDKRADEETDGITVKADAQNRSDSYNIGAGVSAAGKAAVNGTVVVTQTHGTAGAVMDDVIIDNAKTVTANALDDTDILSVIGTVTISGKAAVGAGVAYTEIGDVSTNPDNGQYVTAEIKNSTINTIDTDENEEKAENAAVNVTAKDTARVINVAVGVGGAANAAVQGASATTLINKTTSAAMNNTKIDAPVTDENGDSAIVGSQNANVTVDAQNDSEITSSASTVAAASQGAGVGAGIAVNRIIQQTNAAVNGGTMNVNNLTVKADATPRIENIGVGGAAASQGAGISGSVAVNMIDNDVTAHIGQGAKIVADGNVGVLAASDEQISNYSGMVAGAAQGAGVGISVSVNQIKGETNATVGDAGTNTSITANGDDNNKLKTETDIAETEINNALISSDTVGIDTNIARTEESRSGLIVDASSTRDMKSFLINVAGAGQGAGVAPTVNINMIEGATNAGITDTAVNDGSSNAGNVFVNAGDYTNMSGFVGSGGIAGMGAGVGLGSDTNTVSREVTAKVSGSDINAGEFEIDAESMQGVSSFVVGAAVGGIGAGVAGVVTVTELDNETKAALVNSNVNANKVTINANHKGIVNAGNVGVGVGGIGAGVGLSVGVLKDNSETYAEVTSDNKAEDTIIADGDVTIAATNTAVVKPSISATGAGVAGFAGATSINNLNSKVVTNISDVDITSNKGNISGTADNNFDVDAYMGAQAAGGGGVGAGVTVNTIDSTVQTNVTDSTLNAGNNVELTANENRNITQTATNVAAGASVAVGANIAVTNVGQAVKNDENSNAADKIADANKVYGENNQDANKLLEGAESALKTAEIDSGKATPHVGAELGDGKDSQITVNITGSDIEAGSTVTAKATETDNIIMTLGGASGSISAAAAAGVGILNVHRNVGVDIDGGSIKAGETVNVGTDITGKAELNVYQGSAGTYSGNVAYAGVNTIGSSDINLSSVKLTGKNINITAQDNAKTALHAIGVAAGVVAVGALAAEATNDSNVSVSVNNADITAEEKESKDENGNTVKDDGGNIVYEGGKIEITTNKANTVTAQANNTAGGAIGGTGMGATVTDTGSSKVALAANKMFADNLIDVNAQTSSKLQADIVNSGVGILAAGAVSIAEVNAGTADKNIKTAVTIGEGNTFAADDITFDATSNISESMDMDALAISKYASVGGNSTNSNTYSDVSVTANENNTYKGSYYEKQIGIEKVEVEGEDSNTYEVEKPVIDDGHNAGNVSFNASNTVAQTSDTSGISAAGLFATGTNIGNTTSKLNTKVELNGTNNESKINDLNAKASSYASVTNNVNGNGGAIADISPYAAKVNNNYTADTDVEITGTWNTTGGFTAQAVNGMNIDLKSDAVRAAVIGGSGTWLANTINNAANVTVEDAYITTGGAQNYTAQNTVDYNGEIDGSGYGGLNVNATDYKDDLDFTAGVEIKNSILHGEDDGASITAFANTQGSINSKNSLKSAGVIPVALAFSDHAVDYNNSINVENSDLTTDKADADITLAATDDTEVKLETIADTQGGVVGAASAEASNNFNRANKISIDAESDLFSTRDINLYAGADANGTKSNLNLQVLADAYNKTAIPVYTDPTVNNNMTQSNQIELAGDAESVRHINASAAKGFTTVAESAKEYKVWTGTGGEGDVASTALGDTIKNEEADNYINVTGSAKAGVHNKLDITIGGHSTVKDPVYNADKTEIVDEGGISYDDVEITIGEDSDWFDENQITPSGYRLINGLMERYNQVLEYLDAYAEGSEAYAAYEKEKNLLLAEMQKAGLAEIDESGKLIPLDYIDVPAVTLPDIVVSGGNINIETDTLKGGGEISAQGAPQITITNESDLYLNVQDVTISDNGGNIYLTGEKAFNGNWHEDGTSEATPTITIHGGIKDKDQFTQYGIDRPQADIGIFGNITNTAGDVKIINDNYNILVEGNVSGRNIQISAAKGNVTQQSSSGVLNVGNDPISKLQFSEAVAEKIQQYLYNQKKDGSLEFENYTAYLNWLINTVGITLSELGYAGDVSNITGYTKPWNEVLSAVAQKEGLSDTAANAFLENKKKEGFNAYVSYLNELGIGYKYNAATLDATISEESAGILAGGNIYIDAVNVNIGGLIQSGYGAYSTKLTADDNAKVEELDKEWQANKVALTDNDVLGNSKYLVNGGGEVYNTDTHVWDYEVKVYYNPATGQLLTESVRPEGGNIQISGKISSTGGGRIMAMDGTSDVSIDTTAVNKDVKVNSITVNDVTGLISITDKNVVTKGSDGKDITGWVTEYKNGQWREYAYGIDADASGIEWQTGSKDSYAPVEGTQFAWTGGASGEVIRKKHYTEDFLFWGALSYNTSQELLDHLKQNNIVIDGTIISSASTDNTTPMKDGSLITDGYNGGDNMFRIDWTYSNPEDPDKVHATDPTVKKEYGGTAGKIFGYGKYIYTWTESTGDQMASTSGIKADNPIQIGFIGNGEGDGGAITVNSGKDMLLNGNISNATVIDDDNNFIGKGSVNLNSSGSVSAVDSAYINSDDVNITAATGVNVNHSAIGDSAKINIATDSGDIKFVSAGGDLNIEQAVTGGTNPIDATTGSVYLEAQGNLIDAATGSYAVKGQRIGLISNTGAIGSKDKAFNVLGGSELYSSDTMASSINAQAQGDIVLTQVDGNMRLGTIVSEDGDAVLTVKDGSFVDAHPSENSDSSSAQDKIDRWLEAGLISEDDGAGESTNAAKEAKEERMEALDSRADALAYDAIYEGVIKPEVEKYQKAADAFAKDETIVAAQQTLQEELLAAGDNQALIDNANKKYQQVVANYFAGKGYTEDEQKFIVNNDTAAATKYVFNNSKAETINGYKQAANDLKTAKEKYNNAYNDALTAQNAEIAAANGNTGKIEEITKAYQEKYEAITSDYLAAQDEIYGDNFTEAEQQLISSYAEVDVDESNYGWSKNQLLYAIQESVLNTDPGEVQTVETPNVTANNITLNAAQGGVGIDGEAKVIDYANLNDEANLKLLAQAKAGDLTWHEDTKQVEIRQQQAITVSVKKQDDNSYGKVIVTGKDNVYLAGVKDTELNINGVTTAGDIRLQGDKGVNVDGTLTGYDLTIAGGTGNIMGTGSDKYVDTDIKGTLDANAEGSIYISQTGDLKVLTVATDALADLKATNNILMSDVEGSMAQGYINAQNLNLTAGGSIGAGNAIRILDNGVVINAEANGDIILAGVSGASAEGSEEGLVLDTISGANLDVTNVSSIKQTDDGKITANKVNASATKDILLGREANEVNSFVVTGLGDSNSVDGSVDLVSTSDNGLTVNLNGISADGFVNVVNKAQTDLNISGGSVTTTGENSGSVTFTSGGGINADTTVNSAADIIMDAGGAITNNGALTAQENVNVKTTEGAINLGGTVTASTGNVNVDTQTGDITTIGAVTGKTNVTINSGAGDVDLGGSVDAETGFVNVSTGSGSITTGGYVSGKEDVNLTSNNGDIKVGGYTESETMNVTATVTGDGDIDFTGKVSASGDVKAEVSGKGNITTVDGATVDGMDISFTTNVGNITTGSDLTAKENVDLNVNTGNITFGGNITAKDGNITIDITGNGNLQDAANKDNELKAFSPDGDEAKGNIVINISGKGDVNLYDLFATNEARVDVGNGNLTLNEINGELVAVQLRTQGKEMNVGEIIAGTQIVLTGSNMDLDQITQREDADGMLVMTPDGADDDKPIDNFTIGNIQTNDNNGIRFDKLWVNNSDIHMSQGQLWFDKLYVEDTAHFSTGDMTAAVYGVPPLRDGSDSVYWNNTAENRPEDNLDLWQSGNGDWMYLRFTDDNIQESNGILLTLDEYDYVYDQRFTAEDHMRWQHGRYLDEDWKQAYGYGLSLHDRYGLIDYQNFTEENAGEDEIAVEA